MAILSNVSTRAAIDLDKKEIKARTDVLKLQLDVLQDLLYAESKHSVLLILQGMDASGKDGAIRNVLSGLNPQGVVVKSFKTPTAEELSHDFLWRIHRHTPAKGMIQVFNRSHYEDVLITRVKGWCDEETAKKRFRAINDSERLLQENNTVVLKFYLHVSPKEQQERLNERIHNPQKAWKYNASDFIEARLWDDYMKMYEDVFTYCNQIPWTIVLADQNWYKEYLITTTLVDVLSGLNMQYPKPEEKKEQLSNAIVI